MLPKSAELCGEELSEEQDEILSIIALFRVLKRGIKIAEHGNHKTRDKHTITIAAPIEINGARGNMGVVVNLRNSKYYVHRVIMPDGSSFKFDIKKIQIKKCVRECPMGLLPTLQDLYLTILYPRMKKKAIVFLKKVRKMLPKSAELCGEELSEECGTGRG